MKVTCAIIVQKGYILLARRASSGDRAGLWEFPGGKVREGESYMDCIRREIIEELQISITVGNELPSIHYAYPDKTICLIPFVCSIADGAPKPLVHDEIKWVPPDMLLSYDLCSADRVLAEWMVNNQDSVRM